MNEVKIISEDVIDLTLEEVQSFIKLAETL